MSGWRGALQRRTPIVEGALTSESIRQPKAVGDIPDFMLGGQLLRSIASGGCASVRVVVKPMRRVAQRRWHWPSRSNADCANPVARCGDYPQSCCAPSGTFAPHAEQRSTGPRSGCDCPFDIQAPPPDVN